MSCLNKKADYEFLLPPGEYTLKVTGKGIVDYFEDIYIEPGQKVSQFNFDVSAGRLAHLTGQQAPELTQLKGWLNDQQQKLSDLRGKVVLLDFFRTCCVNGAGPMPKLKLRGIDWVIVGGESGPGARPMAPEWVTDIRDQCRKARVAFHFKQWGGVFKKRNGRLLQGAPGTKCPPSPPISCPPHARTRTRPPTIKLVSGALLRPTAQVPSNSAAPD